MSCRGVPYLVGSQWARSAPLIHYTKGNEVEFYLNTKYDEGTLNSILEAVLDGTPLAEAHKAEGVSYSPAWQFVTWAIKALNGECNDMRGMPEATQSVAVTELRDLKQSWGEIATTLCLNESYCRKLFERYTNVQSVGTRTGKGGRFWGDEQGAELYAAERQGTGVEVVPGTKLDSAVAQVADPSNMSMPLLRAAIRSMGHEGAMPKGKANLVKLYTELKS